MDKFLKQMSITGFRTGELDPKESSWLGCQTMQNQKQRLKWSRQKRRKQKPESIQTHENAAQRAGNVYIQSPELSAEMHYLDALPNAGEPMFPLDHGLRSPGSLGHFAMYESIPSMYVLDYALCCLKP